MWILKGFKDGKFVGETGVGWGREGLERESCRVGGSTWAYGIMQKCVFFEMKMEYIYISIFDDGIGNMDGSKKE